MHGTLQNNFPQLHSFAKNTDISFQKAAAQSNSDISEPFHLPLSHVAMQQCNELTVLLHTNYREGVNDNWSFMWGNHYSTKKMYEAILDPPAAPMPFKWNWKSCCLSRHKFFFWLLLLDRLNTKDLMARKINSMWRIQTVSYALLIRMNILCTYSSIVSSARSFGIASIIPGDTSFDLIDMLLEGKQR